MSHPVVIMKTTQHHHRRRTTGCNKTTSRIQEQRSEITGCSATSTTVPQSLTVPELTQGVYRCNRTNFQQISRTYFNKNKIPVIFTRSRPHARADPVDPMDFAWPYLLSFSWHLLSGTVANPGDHSDPVHHRRKLQGARGHVPPNNFIGGQCPPPQ